MGRSSRRQVWAHELKNQELDVEEVGKVMRAHAMV
jgi:hypothetical protein